MVSENEIWKRFFQAPLTCLGSPGPRLHLHHHRGHRRCSPPSKFRLPQRRLQAQHKWQPAHPPPLGRKPWSGKLATQQVRPESSKHTGSRGVCAIDLGAWWETPSRRRVTLGTTLKRLSGKNQHSAQLMTLYIQNVDTSTNDFADTGLLSRLYKQVFRSV